LLLRDRLARALRILADMHTAETVPVLDDSVIAELRQLGDEVVGEVVTVFLSDAPRRLGKLQHALIEQSRETVVREAHGLKGSALGVGAARLAQLCAAIEQGARAGRLPDLVSESAHLTTEFAEVERALKNP
jgi:HPt (histidine-containing phosphotransfer) domain-containing protein